jgi:CheY-like chemotaxis protein
MRAFAERLNSETGQAKATMDATKLQEGLAPKGSGVVLLVEEEDMVRNLAHMILEASGYVVLEARDGREGLALCAGHQGPIDLLITDLMVAELNGNELAERAVRLRPSLKVLFMSGHLADADGSAFLQKPFTPVGLVEKVREALDSKAPVLGDNSHR